MAEVIITHNRDDIGAAIREALGRIDGVEEMVRGKVVAIKTNETKATAEDQSGVTQADTLRAALRYVKQFEPAELVVTGGAGAAETDDVFRHTGMMDVVEEEGAAFFDHNRPPFQEIELDYAPGRDVEGPQQVVMVNPRVLEYETLIVLSQLKVHATATVTMALKNIAMSYPAADYYGHPRGSEEYHEHDFFEDMHSFIAAMSARFPIDLAVTVGHPAMIGRGPLGGYTFETGLCLASTDAVACDVIGAKLLGFNADGVHHLWEAGRLGLGETDMDKIDTPAMSAKEAYAVFTEAAYGQELQW
jgi:uncharacterized protein (DUF362 family)